jgi:hypothetical protein
MAFDAGLEKLRERRENVLAAVRIGKASTDDLAGVEFELDSAVNRDMDHEARHALVLADHPSLIAGLKRALKAAEIRVEEYESQHKHIFFRDLCRDLADETAVQYMEAARKTLKLFGQMSALYRFYTQHENDLHRKIFLPCFSDLPAMAQAYEGNENDRLAEVSQMTAPEWWRYYGIPVTEDKLKSLGVIIPE